MAASDDPKPVPSPTRAVGPRGTPGSQKSRQSDRPSKFPSVRPGGPESLIGVVLSGRYRIERLLGEGGMGAVYQAEHTHMRKRLAIKVLHPEMSRMSEVVARFEREAMAAAHIDHPNVATATDFGKLEDGSFFLVLEYVEGHSLREELAGGRLELRRALHVTRQIASALQRAHAIGIVHRDLKPENVMLVERDGDPDFAKVLDFGIAKVPVGALAGNSEAAGGKALTQLGMVYGTPEYMAPEQALGQEVDARADLYALGVMAYEMLTGERPFDSESKVQLLGMHVTAPVPPMASKAPDANVPYDVEAIVGKLLAKEASHRYVDAKELIDAIMAVSSKLSNAGRISALPPPRTSMAGSRPDVNAYASNPAIGMAPTSHAGMVNVNSSGPFPSVTNANAAYPASLRRPASFIESAAASFKPLTTLAGQVNRRWLFAGAGLLGLALLSVVGAIVVATTLKSSAASPSSSASGSAMSSAEPPPTVTADPPPLKIDAQIAAASIEVDKGNYASAIDSLAPIEAEYPKNADVHRLLERAYTGIKNAKDAMREAEALLDTDPRLVDDVKLEEDVRNAALGIGTGGVDPGFALLEKKMGVIGVDILYDIAWGQSGQLYPAAAKRARDALAKDAVRSQGSKALQIALDFRDAKTCETKHALLDRARDEGDGRVLAQLKLYLPASGCGFLRRHDCFPCMHRDRALQEAIGAIDARLKTGK